VTSLPPSAHGGYRARFLLSGFGGLKIMMAVTGLILFTFVAFHLSNNLHIYFGREVYNLKGFAWKTPVVIVVARIVLITAVTLHILGGVTLFVRNFRARPIRYHAQRYKVATPYGRAMIITGLIAAAYIVYHVLHAKVGSAHPDLFSMVDESGRRDVYNIIVISFQQPGIAAAYLLGLLGLFLHTAHGISSVILTLGLSRGRTGRAVEWIGPGVSTLLFLGYASLPFFVMVGLLKPKL
jgi:succinate dehydrogenase / fumarate reductase, cytochrome b subunit